MAKQVFILAAGNSERWAGNGSKVLVPLGGEPIILKTIQAVRALRLSPVVFTHDSAVVATVAPYASAITPFARSFLVQTLSSALRTAKPGHDIVVLLGDVVYTEHAMRQICEGSNPLAFFGNMTEIFGLFISAGMVQHITDAIGRVVDEARLGYSWNYGRLRNLYREVEGIPQTEHVIQSVRGIANFVMINDETDDIDTEEQYVAMAAALGAASPLYKKEPGMLVNIPLKDALEHIEGRFGLGESNGFPSLVEAAEQDPHTGWDNGDGDWKPGAIFGVEGKVIYALISALQPSWTWIFGTGAGCSDVHAAEAIKTVGKGRLISVDLLENAGSGIPEELEERRTFFNVDYRELMTQVDSVIEWPDGRRRKLRAPEVFFDDGSHSREDVRLVAEWAKEHLEPGGFFIIHDVAHPSTRENVVGGLEEAGMFELDPPMELYLIAPSDCGIGVWRKPKGE